MATPRRHVVVLHAGGLRSLVATAQALNRADPVRLTLLHVHDGRAAAATRLEHVRRQADHYALTELVELDRRPLFARPTDHRPDGTPHATLATAQVLTAAMAYALERNAHELVWPAAANAETAAVAAAHERRLLVAQLADLEADTLGRPVGMLTELTTPLLSYTDRQVVELGAGLGVPWELAWPCIHRGAQPCGGCPACRRRQAAFRAAGVVDPAFAARRQPAMSR